MSNDHDDRDEDLDDFEDLDPDTPCHDCGGDGLMVEGWDGFRQHSIESGADGPLVKCRNCGGSGLRKDCTVF